MQLKAEASMGFIKEKPAEKTIFGQAVITGLTANAEAFPNLPVAVETLTTNNNDVIAAELAARTGDHIAVSNLKAKVKIWNTNFRLTAKYISLVADGNDATVRLAGFIPTKSETTPSVKPAASSQLAVNMNGCKGNFNAICTPVNSAKAYVFAAVPAGTAVSYNGDTMILTVGDTTMYVVVSTRGKVSFSNVPSGIEMAVSVYAVNSAGSGTAANGQHIIPQ